MKIRRKSKAIWFVNDTKIDTRQINYIAKGNDIRTALYGYFRRSNKDLSNCRIDQMVCHYLNRNLKECNALDNQYIII